MSSGLEVTPAGTAGPRPVGGVGGAPVAGGPARHHRVTVRRATVTLDLVALSGVLATAGVVVAPAVGVPDALAGVGLTATIALAVLAGARCWDTAVLGVGTEEFVRLARATVVGVAVLAGVLALVGAAPELPQAWAVTVLPLAGLVLAAGRLAIRTAVARVRRRGGWVAPVLAVGTPAAIADLVARTTRVPQHGWRVVAACTGPGAGPEIAGVPVVGDLDDVAAAVGRTGAEVVAVAPTPGWTGRRLHELAWRLEGRAVELVVDPGLMEIAGPRLHLTPVDGLPLLRLRPPAFRGGHRLAKAVCDRVVAALLLVLLAPALVLIAVLVRRDGGPVLYRQTRVGRDGEPFAMVKFRSMVVGADTTRGALVNEGAGPLFKVRTDPRVTPVGARLRRFSLDELPQLLNVLGGSMSLVGPRPPLPDEVGAYGEDARRRLLVRPGLTGLWQVSGRSDLSWAETVRLDLRYVENWSPALDLLILARTVTAVLGGRGAY